MPRSNSYAQPSVNAVAPKPAEALAVSAALRPVNANPLPTAPEARANASLLRPYAQASQASQQWEKQVDAPRVNEPPPQSPLPDPEDFEDDEYGTFDADFWSQLDETAASTSQALVGKPVTAPKSTTTAPMSIPPPASPARIPLQSRRDPSVFASQTAPRDEQPDRLAAFRYKAAAGHTRNLLEERVAPYAAPADERSTGQKLPPPSSKTARPVPVRSSASAVIQPPPASITTPREYKQGDSGAIGLVCVEIIDIEHAFDPRGREGPSMGSAPAEPAGQPETVEAPASRSPAPAPDSVRPRASAPVPLPAPSPAPGPQRTPHPGTVSSQTPIPQGQPQSRSLFRFSDVPGPPTPHVTARTPAPPNPTTYPTPRTEAQRSSAYRTPAPRPPMPAPRPAMDTPQVTPVDRRRLFTAEAARETIPRAGISDSRGGRQIPGPAGRLALSTPDSLRRPGSTITIAAPSSDVRSRLGAIHIRRKPRTGAAPVVAVVADDPDFASVAWRNMRRRETLSAIRRESRPVKVEGLVAMVKELRPNDPDATAVLKDPTGEMHALVHKGVLDALPDLCVGTVLELTQVSIHTPFNRAPALNLTFDNIVSSFPPSGNPEKVAPRVPRKRQREGEELEGGEELRRRG
ncbi:hypothetical protein BDK51DRAFT_33477 [Blyttiomyces helicus]|uniref:Homologous recombination OB-fold protein OB-fold domain-containing protein n=1 Tax=Blyttiomyces helicus TaxID=388810 RepID=A0A4P9W4U8_9FUNG|nr:hypothetical protein BDK51DRAFT_33477 [Blyttiomyces helicus]|eukprot:RKO86952.1 hypothetical protein BDK51DRAFT_33477 [Blyttiomyces helicus]